MKRTFDSEPFSATEDSSGKSLTGLLCAIYEATADAILEPCPANQRSRSKSLLTLLTYCYAAEIYSSDEIALSDDPIVHYICTAEVPEEAEIRRFRRKNRAALMLSLSNLFAESSRASMNRACAQKLAMERLQRAALQDSMELDV